jgi:hypothetical protein
MKTEKLSFTKFTDFVLFIMGLNSRRFIHLNNFAYTPKIESLNDDCFLTHFAGQVTMKIVFTNPKILELYEEFRKSDKKYWSRNELNGTNS